MKKPFIIHPFLFAFFPILFLFSHNIEQLAFSEILMPTIIVMCFTIFSVFLLRWVIGDIQKSGIIVSFFLILFFSYGPVLVQLQKIEFLQFIRHRYLLLFWVVIFFFCAFFTIKTYRKLRNLSDFLNIIAVFLVIISLVNIGIYELKKSATWQKSKSIGVNKSATIDLEKTDELRDIYYIILDGYANSGILKEVYGYDNHEFIDYLTEKGFYIAPESRSNYGSTFLSLASSLNMEYINYLADIVGTSSTDRSIPYQMIEFNKVADFLKSRGYKFVHFGSSWGPTQNNSLANLSFDFSIENEFRMQLIQMTVLRVFESRFGFIKADARNQILRTFSKLAEVHKINEPIFVFAHIISPHPPYLFGANGEPVPETSLEMDGDIWEEKNKYLDQLAFINKKVKILVEKILSSSEIPPIIILQADHGSASLFSSSDGGGWDDPTEEMINERMKIFNAYYLPNGGGDTLYNSITPVNTFRLIFDFYFRADSYELFGDQSYYSTYGRPYNFIDISGKIH